MRYNKIHKTIRIYKSLLGKNIKWQCWKTEFTPPPQCMPDEYKHKDYITAYKQYYIGEKKDLQSILELTHQILCVNVIHHEKNNQ